MPEDPRDALARYVARVGEPRPARITREEAQAVAREMGIDDAALAEAEERAWAGLRAAEGLLQRDLFDAALATAEDAGTLLPWEAGFDRVVLSALARRWRSGGAATDRSRGLRLALALASEIPGDPAVIGAL